MLTLREKEIVKTETDRCLQAVADEPELPGDMPDEIWNAVKNDRDALQKLCRICCAETKDGIRKRILENVKSEPRLYVAQSVRKHDL